MVVLVISIFNPPSLEGTWNPRALGIGIMEPTDSKMLRLLNPLNPHEKSSAPVNMNAFWTLWEAKKLRDARQALRLARAARDAEGALLAEQRVKPLKRSR